VLATPGNLGKTRALALGLAQVATEHVLLLDADLQGLTAADVSALLAPVLSGRAAASLSLRGNAPAPWRWIGIDYISGERVLPMALLRDSLARLDRLPRFGFEVFLNRLLIGAGRSVAIVRWPGVRSPLKAEKQGVWAGIRGDAAMIADIFRTIGPVECLRQIAGLRRLSTGRGGGFHPPYGGG
jgi:glycosyltransferase involved in cell wall biosynthesis